MAQNALRSPWGRMMRAIRDNETSAEAMGKDVTKRHLQIFVLGSAICGIAGAMMTTLDGQLTPAGYQPLRMLKLCGFTGGKGYLRGEQVFGKIVFRRFLISTLFWCILAQNRASGASYKHREAMQSPGGPAARC